MTDEPSATDVAPLVESLPDPAALHDRDGITVRDETRTLDPSAFEHWRERAGLTGIGVTNRDGELLLMDGVHGWSLPYAEVDPGEDWAAVARRGVENLTGVTVSIDGVARAACVENRLRDSGDSRTTYEVVFRSRPVESDAVADRENGVSDDLPEVAWFDAVPEGAGRHDDAEDEVADVRLFLD